LPYKTICEVKQLREEEGILMGSLVEKDFGCASQNGTIIGTDGEDIFKDAKPEISSTFACFRRVFVKYFCSSSGGL
jgi:hypothetical protein